MLTAWLNKTSYWATEGGRHQLQPRHWEEIKSNMKPALQNKPNPKPAVSSFIKNLQQNLDTNSTRSSNDFKAHSASKGSAVKDSSVTHDKPLVPRGSAVKDSSVTRDKPHVPWGSAVKDSSVTRDQTLEPRGSAVKDSSVTRDKPHVPWGSAVKDSSVTRDKPHVPWGSAVKDSSVTRDQPLEPRGSAVKDSSVTRDKPHVPWGSAVKDSSVTRDKPLVPWGSAVKNSSVTGEQPLVPRGSTVKDSSVTREQPLVPRRSAVKDSSVTREQPLVPRGSAVKDSSVTREQPLVPRRSTTKFTGIVAKGDSEKQPPVAKKGHGPIIKTKSLENTDEVTSSSKITHNHRFSMGGIEMLKSPRPEPPPKVERPTATQMRESIDQSTAVDPDQANTPQDTSPGSSPSTQKTNMSPPALPAKVNRPKFKRQSGHVTSQDDSQLTSAEGHTSRILRLSQSMDNLDAKCAEDDGGILSPKDVKADVLALHHKSIVQDIVKHSSSDSWAPQKVEREPDQRELSRAPSNGSSKKFKSPGFMRKRNKDAKKVDRNSKSDDVCGKAKSRWSIGDKFKSNAVFENICKATKTALGQKSSTRMKGAKCRDTNSSPTDEHSHVTQNTAGISSSDTLVHDPCKTACDLQGADDSIVEDASRLTDEDDDTDDDVEWDDFSEDDDVDGHLETSDLSPETVCIGLTDSQVEDGPHKPASIKPEGSPHCSDRRTPERSSCYENFTNYTMTFKNRKRLVEEIVSTEQTYVSKLYLLNKASWEIAGANMMLEMFPAAAVHQMFPCIETMYQLHGENILPALKSRLENWTSRSELSALWKKYLPFLTMYKTYTSQYDWALETISQNRKASVDFNQCFIRIQNKPEFGKLTLEQHLLEPIQRLARYRLLLQNYSKLLTSDNTERENIADVLESFNDLLNSCQHQLKKRDMFDDMCKLQDEFEDSLSMLTPTVQLVKKGITTEIRGVTSKKTSQRYIFLFTDSLLLCSKRQSTGKFRIIHQMSLPEVEVDRVDQVTAQLFGAEKSMKLVEKDSTVQLCFDDIDTKEQWLKEILDARTTNARKHELRKNGSFKEISAVQLS